MRGDYENEKEAIAILFREMSEKWHEAVGGYEALLLIGAMLSFVGAPEYYRSERGFPGAFLHGETRQGKTTNMGWGMEFWGFHNARGLGVSRNLTAVGLQIVGEQYSNVPVWLTDYDANEVSEEKRQIMHDSFNRARASKWSPDGKMRVMRTTFLIDGESRPTKTSTRYRYVQILVSKERRKGDHVPWFEKNRKFFFTIVRFLLRHRDKFSKEMMSAYREFSELLEHTDKRAVVVHGAAVGALCAANKLIGGIPEPTFTSFLGFSAAYAMESAAEGLQAVNVNQFWRDLISAFRRNVFGEGGEQKRFFRVKDTIIPRAPGTPEDTTQTEWRSYILYIEINSVLDMMQRDARTRGATLALDKSDLREQMSRRPYWRGDCVGKGAKKMRFNGGYGVHCWGIELDMMAELGYTAVDDATLAKSKEAAVDRALPYPNYEPDDWADPRKGDLYVIVDAIYKSQNREKDT